MCISVIPSRVSNDRRQIKVIMDSTSSEDVNTLLRDGGLLGIIQINTLERSEVQIFESDHRGPKG